MGASMKTARIPICGCPCGCVRHIAEEDYHGINSRCVQCIDGNHVKPKENPDNPYTRRLF